MKAKSFRADPNKTFVVLGRLGRAHGVRGWLNVDFVGQHLRDFVGSTVELTPVISMAPLIHDPPSLRTQKLLAAKPEQGAIKRLLFAGIEDRDAAMALSNCCIVMPLQAMRQRINAERKTMNCSLKDLWYFEIYGLYVVDAQSKQGIGVITAIEDLGHNTLITVTLSSGIAAQNPDLEIPLDYPFWGYADLSKQEISLAEWRQFLDE